jgi:hypothetical protein
VKLNVGTMIDMHSNVDKACAVKDLHGAISKAISQLHNSFEGILHSADEIRLGLYNEEETSKKSNGYVPSSKSNGPTATAAVTNVNRVPCSSGCAMAADIVFQAHGCLNLRCKKREC